MARPREFNEEVVLDRALETFWARGYDATSVEDILQATKLTKGSLYKGFGDKHSLFLRTLDRYLERGRATYSRLDDGVRPPFEIFRTWFNNALKQGFSSPRVRGCYAVNCIVELAPHDNEVKRRIQAHDKRLERLFEATLKRGIETGLTSSKVDPAACARWLLTSLSGIQVRAKAGMCQADATAMIEFALAPIMGS